MADAFMFANGNLLKGKKFGCMESSLIALGGKPDKATSLLTQWRFLGASRERLEELCGGIDIFKYVGLRGVGELNVVEAGETTAFLNNNLRRKLPTGALCTHLHDGTDSKVGHAFAILSPRAFPDNVWDRFLKQGAVPVFDINEPNQVSYHKTIREITTYLLTFREAMVLFLVKKE